MKINTLLILICFLIVSCNPGKRVIQNSQEEQIILTKVKYKPKESLYFNLWRMIEYYTQIYSKCPKSANDLIILIERSDENYQMINDNVYQFLKKNKGNLIFITSVDSTTTIYNGKIKANRVVEKADYASPCSNIKFAQVNFFDKQGHYFRNDSLAHLINIELNPIYIKHQEQLKPSADVHRTGSRYDKIIVEITVVGMKNLCSNTYIDLSTSSLFAEIYNYLYKIASDNSIPRIIIPIYPPEG